MSRSLLPAINSCEDLPILTETDVLVIGAGIAGLSFTLTLPPQLRVVLVTKGALGESNTWYAQGGLAAAVGPDDDPSLHLADTLVAGAGLCDERAVEVLVEGGPDAVRWLIQQGTHFDEEDSQLALGKEAAHSRNRVIHAGGDATGSEIERSLVAQIKARPTVSILQHTSALDLILNADGSCAGAIVVEGEESPPVRVKAAVTVLANGGAGRLWKVTSNPPGATGDGIAMALRAGATVADLEFTQFHPTVLAGANHDPFLITEAIRGEGAYLRSTDGERFMVPLHELAELAPRDVVARAIQDQIAKDGGKPVFLDLRHLDPEMVRHRFPTILARLQEDGISLTDDLIPVAPAAHYFMGGVVADTEGKTSMPGLIAIGEVSCTGVHGANRLASNSLLEGLVFGLRAAKFVANATLRAPDETVYSPFAKSKEQGEIDHLAIRSEIQETMSANVAVVRSKESLVRALAVFASMSEHVMGLDRYKASEVQNALVLASEITESALVREESRGGHFRSDFLETDPTLDGQHQLVANRNSNVRRWYGHLHQ